MSNIISENINDPEVVRLIADAITSQTSGVVQSVLGLVAQRIREKENAARVETAVNFPLVVSLDFVRDPRPLGARTANLNDAIIQDQLERNTVVSESVRSNEIPNPQSRRERNKRPKNATLGRAEGNLSEVKRLIELSIQRFSEEGSLSKMDIVSQCKEVMKRIQKNSTRIIVSVFLNIDQICNWGKVPSAIQDQLFDQLVTACDSREHHIGRSVNEWAPRAIFTSKWKSLKGSIEGDREKFLVTHAQVINRLRLNVRNA